MKDIDMTIARRFSLLLVDDSVAVRDLYECVLEAEFDVLTAGRGSDGIELAAAAHPDAIVLDVMMPGMDGWEACTRLKRNPATADIPVILLTGTDETELSQRAIAAGASAILQKPCPADRLQQAVLAALGSGGQTG